MSMITLMTMSMAMLSKMFLKGRSEKYFDMRINFSVNIMFFYQNTIFAPWHTPCTHVRTVQINLKKIYIDSDHKCICGDDDHQIYLTYCSNSAQLREGLDVEGRDLDLVKYFHLIFRERIQEEERDKRYKTSNTSHITVHLFIILYDFPSKLWLCIVTHVHKHKPAQALTSMNKHRHKK